MSETPEQKLYRHVGHICNEAYHAGKKQSGVFSPPVDDMAAIRTAFERAEEAELLERAWSKLQALHDLCPPGRRADCDVQYNPDPLTCVRCLAEWEAEADGQAR